MKTINQKYQTNGALLVGPVVPRGDIVSGKNLGVGLDNKVRFVNLAASYMVRRHSDGWFVNGASKRSQIWESGVGLLGLTVISRHLLRKCAPERHWLVPKQIGDDEGNFYCLWNDENLTRLNSLVGLKRRQTDRNRHPLPIPGSKAKDAKET